LGDIGKTLDYQYAFGVADAFVVMDGVKLRLGIHLFIYLQHQASLG